MSGRIMGLNASKSRSGAWPRRNSANTRMRNDRTHSPSSSLPPFSFHFLSFSSPFRRNVRMTKSNATVDCLRLKELCMRYEEPDSRNRWDQPCHVIQQDEQITPCETILASIIGQPAPMANFFTTPETCLSHQLYLRAGRRHKKNH